MLLLSMAAIFLRFPLEECRPKVQPPAHEAGASRGGTWSTGRGLSTHVPLQTHELSPRVQIRMKNAQSAFVYVQLGPSARLTFSSASRGSYPFHKSGKSRGSYGAGWSSRVARRANIGVRFQNRRKSRSFNGAAWSRSVARRANIAEERQVE